MNKILIGISILVLLGIGGVFAYQSMYPKAIEQDKAMENPTIPTKDIPQNGTGYVEYSKAFYDSSTNSKRVLFFHAKWCPTCKVANEEFSGDISKIPSGVIIFKTDYDTESELKKKYGVTYQHTFVQVDETGKELAKWNGGGIAELTANLK